jgi:hypothetical protein
VSGDEYLVTFHRWKNQLEQIEVSEAKRLKQLEGENAELKKMLAESLRKNRVLEAGVRQKVLSPKQRRRAARATVFWAWSTYSYRSKEPRS